MEVIPQCVEQEVVGNKLEPEKPWLKRHHHSSQQQTDSKYYNLLFNLQTLCQPTARNKKHIDEE